MSKWGYVPIAVAMVAGAQQKPVNFYSWIRKPSSARGWPVR